MSEVSGGFYLDGVAPLGFWNGRNFLEMVDGTRARIEDRVWGKGRRRWIKSGSPRYIFQSHHLLLPSPTRHTVYNRP